MKGGIFLRKMPLKAYGSWIQQLWNRFSPCQTFVLE